MTDLHGNNAIYTGNIIYSSTEYVVNRYPTEDTTDYFDTASNIMYAWLAANDSERIGESIVFRVKNDSDYIINVEPGEGILMVSDVITPRTAVSYLLVKQSEDNVKITKTSSGTEMNSSGIFLKDICVYGTVFDYKSVASISATEGITYTTGQILGGYIKRTCTANYTDSLPSAVNIISAIKYSKIGMSFYCYIQNSSSINKILTLSGNSGITLSGNTTTVLKGSTVLLLFTITGSNTVMCYIMGVLTSASGGDAALITPVTNPSYTLLASDSTINVDTNTIKSVCTLTLPIISTIGQKRYFITDSSGKAGLYNIRIVPSGYDTIIGTTSVTINSNYSSISMYNDEFGNWILY